jgi:ribosomal protein S18 acetylase RimI-like enzyme
MPVRIAEPRDAPAVIAVCQATARNGEPVANDDPAAALLPAVYAEPYLALEPHSSRVLVDHDGTVVGYAVAALHSREFCARWRRDWSVRFPPPGPHQGEVTRLLQLLAQPERMLADDATVDAFPSHLHIDLLPQVRGRGEGRALLSAVLAGLAASGSTGVHLAVDPGNHRARAFYARTGFTPAATQSLDDALVLVRRLTAGA